MARTRDADADRCTIDFEKTRKRLITENYYDQRKLLRKTKTLTTIGFQVSIFRANNPSDVYSQVFVYYTGILLTWNRNMEGNSNNENPREDLRIYDLSACSVRMDDWMFRTR